MKFSRRIPRPVGGVIHFFCTLSTPKGIPKLLAPRYFVWVIYVSQIDKLSLFNTNYAL